MSRVSVLASICLVLSVAVGASAQHTFRIAALEYNGRGAGAGNSSDVKMNTLYSGLNTVLTAQQNAGTAIDLIVTSELPTMVGSEDGFSRMAQAIPGTRSNQLGAIAKQYNTWMVSGLLERGPAPTYYMYNTAVVFNRNGDLVAKYRKVVLPDSESSRGIKPGTDPMVIDTEFGRMGVMLCWEASAYSDPNYGYFQQVMALNPDFIAHPSWADFSNDLTYLTHEYGVYFASSAWDGSSRIVGPNGMLDTQLYDGADPALMKIAVANITVPEPMTLALLAVGTLAIARRTRRVRVTTAA